VDGRGGQGEVLDAGVYRRYCEALVIVFVLPLAYLAHSATVWSTTLIGVNRYVAVCHPYQVQPTNQWRN